MIVLSATDITVIRSRRKLVDAVSIHLHAGEMTALMGENGAGKSTLLKVCTGEIQPGRRSRGTVTLAGKSLAHWKAIECAKLRAVLPQESNVAFQMTATEVVLLGRSPHCNGYPGATDLNIAREAMALVDVVHLENRLFPTLSGGERARVMLARVLAQIWTPWRDQPRCLLLDEPIAALDIAHQHLALDIVHTFAREQGVAVMAVIHDLNLALQYADKVALLKGGQLHSCGSPDEVLTPEHIAQCFQLSMIRLTHPHSHRPVLIAA
jgi:iron complex transport system ATP-binding protein